MWSLSNKGNVERVSDESEILSLLERIKLDVQSVNAILIGSRAAQIWLPNFRRRSDDSNTDWDIICSSQFLVAWFKKKEQSVKTMEMLMPKCDNSELLDVYVFCVLDDNATYDFSVPRSTKSYTAYLLNNLNAWTKETYDGSWWNKYRNPIQTGAPKLLFILKRYMLYYSHQWAKTANDYRELLTIVEPLAEEDKALCNLFIQYNTQIHGNRTNNSDQFVIPKSTNESESIVVRKDEFLSLSTNEQISLIYDSAMSMAICNDILIGLEVLCTQSPSWLADFVIDHWISIFREKFKKTIITSEESLELEVKDYRLFPEIPELVLQRIIHNITDTRDFYSMQFVCKKWYTILQKETFWRDIYLSRYGKAYNQTDGGYHWKILYFISLEKNVRHDGKELQILANASHELRQTKPMDIVQLWEDLTHEDQSISSEMYSHLHQILSNSYYVELKLEPDKCYSKLVIIGLEETCSHVTAHLQLKFGEYGSSRFTDYMEEVSIELILDSDTKRSLKFRGPHLFGFYLGKWGYYTNKCTLLDSIPSDLCSKLPSGLVVCLFIMLTHPDHRGQLIQYLKRLEATCAHVSSQREY